MRIFLSSQFIKSFKKLQKKDPKVVPKVKEKINLFKLNPLHPSLKLDKLKGKKIEIWSFWIKGDLRITFVYLTGGVLFINIGTHKEVY